MNLAPLQRPWIHGAHLDVGAATTFPTRNPATGELLADVQHCDDDVVDAAVAAAAAAWQPWYELGGAERGRRLRRVADLLRERNDDLARLETLDTGRPLAETSVVDVVSGAECFEYFAGIAATLAGEALTLPGALAYTLRSPLGVCAAIGAWNYPLQIACWKAAPALACGNAVVFKPSELTPLSAPMLAEIMDEAGVPPGVFNVVHGDGATGAALVAHPEVAKVSLTGEVGTGRKVMAGAAPTLKHVTLELGGKSPIIVFDDASLDDAVSGALLGNFYSQGEICSNGTRVFVHDAVRDEFIERVAARASRMRIGDPMDPATDVGPLISIEHATRVRGYIERAGRSGARLVVGGHEPVAVDAPLDPAAFVAPTLFAECSDDLEVVREEVFGPVMAVLGFSDDDEVIERANATPFGLAAGVFTSDVTRAHRTAARLSAGVVWVNTYNITPVELPFGGVKQSGLGRENGWAAVEHYTQRTSVYVALDGVDSPY